MIALPEDEHIVLINRFTGHPDRSEELLALLVHATENTMRHQPGFISAKLHKSLEGFSHRQLCAVAIPGCARSDAGKSRST